MANSRYDNIRYWDDNSKSFKVPTQIKAWNAETSTWIDYGTKDSTSQKKINAFDTNQMKCFTYKRNDVNIPKSVNIGSNKFLYLKKQNGSNLAVDIYNSNYYFEMKVKVNSTTPLYTSFTKSQGNIVNQSYVSLVSEVSGNTVRLRMSSHFSGNRITDLKYVDVTTTKYTSYCFTVGETVRIVMTTSGTNGTVNVKVYNSSNTELYNDNLYFNTQWVGTPNIHRLGSETIDRAGNQRTYGNADILYFKTTPIETRSSFFILDIANQINNVTSINSSGGYAGRADCSGTNVYGESYTEYIRQEV